MGLTIIGKTRIVIRYLRCIKYRDGCPARARLYLELDVFSVSGEPFCPGSTENQTEISKVVSRIKINQKFRNANFVKSLMRKSINQKLVGI